MSADTQNRRDFIRNAALFGAAASLTGCANQIRLAPGGAMGGFALKPMETVRVGFVGIGGRGTAAVKRVSAIPGVEIAALCDLKEERIRLNADWLKERGRKAPLEFLGPEGWKRLCDSDAVDVVYNCCPWSMHLPPSVRAMKNGKVPLVEVPATLSVDECWEYVETSEKCRMPCMMLENCCYGEEELFMLNLAQKGVLGEVIHGECGYIHWCAYFEYPKTADSAETWRLTEGMRHTGNLYPTHGFGPTALAMDVNRGDRLDYLVSVGSRARAFPAFAERKFGRDSALARLPVEANDINTSVVRTMRGNTIMLQYCCAFPRPYTRMNLLSGTLGTVRETERSGDLKGGRYPLHLALAGSPTDDVNCLKAEKWVDGETLAAYRAKYEHPLVAEMKGISNAFDGHGGMDFRMDLRWAYCLQKGLPLDMDVYDLATWSSLAELTERSTRARGATVDIPDYTRGAWKSAKPFPELSFDGDWLRRKA